MPHSSRPPLPLKCLQEPRGEAGGFGLEVIRPLPLHVASEGISVGEAVIPLALTAPLARCYHFHLRSLEPLLR